MKNKFSYILMVLLLASCNNFLDYNEYDFLEKDDVFTVFDRAKSSLTNLYGVIPSSGIDDVGGSMRSSATDDALESDKARIIHIMNDGRWSAIRTIDEQWSQMYNGIRSANLFLNNYDMSILEKYHFNDDYQNLVLEYTHFDEQARFLRVYFYYELIRRYGQVPLLGDKLLTMEEVNDVKPNSFEEVVNYIVNECDAIIDGLPIDYKGFTGDQSGRITKGVAMALKARILLYAASPLHNPENAQDKWIAAAKAAWDIIKTEWYSLENDYKNVVNNSQSKELIFGRRRGNENSFERRNFPVGYVGASPGNCPTQNLVDCYRMINGKRIDDTDSGYDPTDPYTNRDPRLLKTIIVNNSQWKDRKVEIWNGGLDGLPKEYASETGYYLKKYVVETVNLDPSYTSTARHLVVIFRYGEVLLNYAEAMNEAYGPTYKSTELGMSAYEAVNLIRERSNMPNFENGMNKDEFRNELRDERRIEMAFEDHRFWDIRRWKIGNSTTNIKGTAITKNDDGTFIYNTKNIETRVWDEKMNFYPIPQDEIFKNKNLVQNPGW
jgi:hypothetical protein